MAISIAARLGSNIVLAKLLTPDAFGAVGVVMSIVAVLSLATDMGFYAFIIRHNKGEDKRFLDCVWTIRLVRCVFLAAIVALGSNGLASLYSQSELATAIVFVGLFFLLEGLTSLGLITASRQERVAFVSIFELGFHIFQIAITIAFSYWLRNYWALLIGGAIVGVVKAIASFVLIPGSARRLAYDPKLASELFHFSKFIAGSSIITLVLSQTDKVVFSRILSLEELGLVVLSASIVQAFSSLSYAYVIRVTYPLLSRTYQGNSDDVSRKLYSSRRIFSLLFALVAGGLAGGGDLAVRILFDDRYLAAGLYLSIFALAPAANANALFSEQTLTACGHVRATLVFNILRICYLLTVGPIVYLLHGPIGLLIVVGTIDYVPMLAGWWRLRQLNILVPHEEIIYCACFVVGCGLGVGVDRFANWLVLNGLIPAF